MFRLLSRLACGIVAMGAPFSPANAAVITSLNGATAIVIPSVSDDDGVAATKGPVAFGPGITYTATSAASLFGYTGQYGFTPTSLWRGTPMIGLNVGRGTVTLDFATPLAGFLAEISSTEYASSSDAIITAFDAAGNQLDRIVLERNGYQVKPGYMGFGYALPAISRITFANEYIGFRNISVLASTTVGAVPEPVTWAMMILGMGMIGMRLRRTHAPHPQAG